MIWLSVHSLPGGRRGSEGDADGVYKSLKLLQTCNTLLTFALKNTEKCEKICRFFRLMLENTCFVAEMLTQCLQHFVISVNIVKNGKKHLQMSHVFVIIMS